MPTGPLEPGFSAPLPCVSLPHPLPASVPLHTLCCCLQHLFPHPCIGCRTPFQDHQCLGSQEDTRGFKCVYQTVKGTANVSSSHGSSPQLSPGAPALGSRFACSFLAEVNQTGSETHGRKQVRPALESSSPLTWAALELLRQSREAAS